MFEKKKKFIHSFSWIFQLENYSFIFCSLLFANASTTDSTEEVQCFCTHSVFYQGSSCPFLP